MSFKIIGVAGSLVSVQSDEGHIWHFNFSNYSAGDIPNEIVWKDGKISDDPLATRSAATAAITEALRLKLLRS